MTIGKGKQHLLLMRFCNGVDDNSTRFRCKYWLLNHRSLDIFRMVLIFHEQRLHSLQSLKLKVDCEVVWPLWVSESV